MISNIFGMILVILGICFSFVLFIGAFTVFAFKFAEEWNESLGDQILGEAPGDWARVGELKEAHS